MKKLKWLLGLTLLIAALALAGFTYYTRSQKADFLTAKVQRGDLESAISATGSLAAVISVAVGSQVSGNVAALYADFNSVVKKGQLVAQIDPAPFQTKVDQAKANLDSAKAQITNAEVGLEESGSGHRQRRAEHHQPEGRGGSGAVPGQRRQAETGSPGQDVRRGASAPRTLATAPRQSTTRLWRAWNRRRRR